jgi:RNA-directed DNA polymerase
MTLVAWAMRKFKRLRRRKARAICFLVDLSRKLPKLFAHWKRGMVGAFA